MTKHIWKNTEFKEKLERSIEANNIIFQTLTLDPLLGGRKRGKNKTVKHIFSRKKKQRKTLKTKK